MANESRRVYDEYLVALDQTKVQVKTLNNDGSASYIDIRNYDDLTNAGYHLVHVADMQVVTDGDIYPIGADNFTFNASEITSTVLVNLLNSGYFILTKSNDIGSGNPENLTSVAIDTGLQEVADETLLRKAEAKYEADMRKIDMKDRKYDTDLAALEAERNAIKSEMETLKTVAKDNVERTFKLFS
ncbi:MAG: hypothetical protein K6E29_09720 [Cyanobacteria bacterium RUI128]|nr:hypothetical protein [Cyanobacteria bacterium RUI128]